ncbi:MAG: hypothetical protein E6G77_14900 [Alphaproteobacteria bacterium]|nr:MAG: hypothetical protein E6G77_14900 [Alphaproteobacteria bacterium]
MTIDRRRFLELAGGAALAPALSHSAWAQAYPARPVQLVVPYPPGSGPDIIGRLTAQHLSERLGQQFIVENRPGASTNIGTEYVAKAEPDGDTILLPVSTNAVNVALYRNLNFDFIRDIAPIAGIAKTPFIIVVPPSFPAHDQNQNGSRSLSRELHARFARRAGAGRFRSHRTSSPADTRRKAARTWGDNCATRGGAAGHPCHRRVSERLRWLRVVWAGCARQDAT